MEVLWLTVNCVTSVIFSFLFPSASWNCSVTAGWTWNKAAVLPLKVHSRRSFCNWPRFVRRLSWHFIQKRKKGHVSLLNGENIYCMYNLPSRFMCRSASKLVHLCILCSTDEFFCHPSLPSRQIGRRFYTVVKYQNYFMEVFYLSDNTTYI